MKRIMPYLVLLNLIFILSSCSTPEKPSTIEKILENKVMVVGTTGEQFPFSYKGPDGELKGVDIKMSKKLAKDLGVDVKFELMEFDHLIPAVMEGKVDIVFSGVSVTAERNAKVIFPGVYFKSSKSILTKDKEIATGTLDIVNKPEVSLAVITSTTSEEYVKEKYPLANIVEVATVAEAVKLLSADKVNGFVTDYETSQLIAFANTKDQLYFESLSKSIEKEMLSPVIASGDCVFSNLVSNFITRINALDKTDAIDHIWDDFLKYEIE